MPMISRFPAPVLRGDTLFPRMTEEYRLPPIRPAIDDTLGDFAARRKRAGGTTLETDFGGAWNRLRRSGNRRIREFQP